MRISDWSSDVCSSDLYDQGRPAIARDQGCRPRCRRACRRRTAAHDPRHTRRGAPPLRDLSVREISRAISSQVESPGEIGIASCRARLSMYVEISVVAVALKTKETTTIHVQKVHHE